MAKSTDAELLEAAAARFNARMADPAEAKRVRVTINRSLGAYAPPKGYTIPQPDHMIRK